MANKPLCIVAGVGPGNGMAFTRKFLTQGYQVAILARNLERLQDYAADNQDIVPFTCDLSDPESIQSTFASIHESLGPPTVVIYNADKGVFGTAMDATVGDFEEAWRLNTLGLLTVAQETAPVMVKNGGGSLLVTGATASLRGGANFAAFSSAKGAQRHLAQSLARSLGTQGIHVALVIIDGIIDSDLARSRFPDKPDSFFLQADAIAETYFNLSKQHPSAWTFEVDLRTSAESW